MPSKQSQTTRLLCASAFLSGSSYRQFVLQFLKDQNRAVPPEVGLDIELVAKVCSYAERREQRYWILFFLVAAFAAFSASVIDLGLALFVLVLASAGVYFHKVYQERYALARLFQRDGFNPDHVSSEFGAGFDGEHADALPQADQNLIVYKGFTPFVGAGIDLGGWSFIIAIDKPREGLSDQAEPIPFTSEELYGAVDRAIVSLGLEGLSSKDYHFVYGCDIREDHAILSRIDGRPTQVLDADRAAQYRITSDSRIRHYKWICVQDWGNELIMSFFLRCVVRGNSLFVEVKRFLLTPISDQYRAIDRISGPSWRSVVALLFQSVIAAPFFALFSPFALFGKLIEGVAKLTDHEGRRRRRQIEENPLFNYGADRSIRQLFSSDRFGHYFQKIDGDFYIKVLEGAILDEIVSFLDEHNIDTSEIRERQTTILNSGIIVQGGDIQAESLAVGAGAQATKTVERSTRRRVLTRGDGV